jgi:Na+-driven multidrug efflux pump
MLKIGIPGSMQMLLRGFMNLVLMAVVAGFGVYAIAAFGVGMRLHMIAMMPGFAFGSAAATLVGQNLGAKNPGRAAKSAFTATFYYLIFMTTLAVLFYIFAPSLISVFNKDPNVIAIGTDYIRITCFGYIFIAVGLVLGRALMGAGDTISPLIITFFSLWILQVPLAIFLSRVPSFGLTGVWYAILIATVALGVVTSSWFSLGRWKAKKV